MKLIDNGGSSGLCGSWTNYYNVEFDKENLTVEDALKEIEEWKRRENINDLDEIKIEYYFLSNTKNSFYSRIEKTVYTNSSYNEKDYNGEYNNEKVFSCCGYGRWYCGLTLEIRVYTEDLLEYKEKRKEEKTDIVKWKKEYRGLKKRLKWLEENVPEVLEEED